MVISAYPDPSPICGHRNIPNSTMSSTINMSSRFRPELSPILNAIDPVRMGFSLFLFLLLIFVPDDIAYSAYRLDEADAVHFVYLAAQISDIYIDYIGLAHVIISPDLAEKAVP